MHKEKDLKPVFKALFNCNDGNSKREFYYQHMLTTAAFLRSSLPRMNFSQIINRGWGGNGTHKVQTSEWIG